MAAKDQLLGWDVSPYTVKVKSYFNFKKIPYDYKPPNVYTLSRKVQPAAGKIIMPTVFRANGTMVQDSSVIIDVYEADCKEPAVIPETPDQAFASLLVELFADEWMPLAALHYRWNYPGNYDFILGEFGKNALPGFPGFIQRAAVRKFARKLSGYLPILGVTKNMEPALEAAAEELLGLLDHHFKEHPFLLGGQPTIGDFALYGPLYAHMDRDPEPRNLIRKYDHLYRWLMVMHGNFDNSVANGAGDLLPNDEIPDSLLAVLHYISELHSPLLQQTIAGIREWDQKNPDIGKLPSRLGQASISIKGVTETRYNLTYSYWMIQRIRDKVKARGGADSLIEALNLGDIFIQPLPIEVSLERTRLYRIPGPVPEPI
ncbi:MAG: hypothetical protein CSB48_07100 [Proteobacteria bacterium]|nr:MAG: hypothetical protein CSB48_07100 [Pseudomonadota bacterium]PIE40146.1 MAG: hypothetical protein CSA51_01910 [Gammaproteobacteria bacterium]